MSENTRGASIELRNLVKRYNGLAALRDVSLDLPAGEFVTLLGPSGSGKTTTLNTISGFLKPDEGQVLMNGHRIEAVPPHKRDIGMVFQSYALFPHMTVSANVAFPLKRRKVPKAELRERVGRSLELVGLDGMGGRHPRELSGGQQQRVALARALVFEPSVLLMDEPLGALDRRLRATLQLEFKRIHRELGITFVYVTHDQDEALVMSDRIAVFNNGSIEQVGTAEDLYERPASLFVAEFLGDSNVLPGVVDGVVGAGTGRLHGDRYDLAVPDGSPLAPGSRGVMVVRPERLAVVPEHANGTHANALPGRVKQLIYMGGIRRLEVELDAGFTVVSQEQAGAESTVRPGDAVLATWDPNQSVILPDRGEHALAGAVTGSLDD
ncbi:polyamine ABC transporter ATP-binding protein [Nocardioides aromaticivorans]|uniref:Spermidine/putrescine import ATP-binding protein PotA n=1 Tax=Nocardioides aromaticivorans TaxID=200618 RepID=A0ABX7PGE7_9ACTN|nr:ABC transporter ATP-binding protein [Nocardioides aromaticivorans]QSR24847.1 polyamine ABC transporter ATP-binding protein [Nocardioides aromaticivorans]